MWPPPRRDRKVLRILPSHRDQIFFYYIAASRLTSSRRFRAMESHVSDMQGRRRNYNGPLRVGFPFDSLNRLLITSVAINTYTTDSITGGLLMSQNTN